MKHRHDTAHATAHLPLAVPGRGVALSVRGFHAVKRERGVCATWGHLARVVRWSMARVVRWSMGRVVRWSMGRGADILGQGGGVDRRSAVLMSACTRLNRESEGKL